MTTGLDIIIHGGITPVIIALVITFILGTLYIYWDYSEKMKLIQKIKR